MSINSNLCQFGFLSSSVKFSFESFEEISNNLEVPKSWNAEVCASKLCEKN